MPELVVRGGTVVTVGPQGTLVGDVAIDGGRIVAIGAAVGRGEVEVDARGCLVVPGLVQAHVHLGQTLFRGLAGSVDVVAWLRERVWPLEQAHTSESMAASAALGAAELLLGGTTSALSMETVHHTDASFAAAERLGLRAWIGKALMDAWEPGTEMEGESTDDAWADAERLVARWHGAAGDRIRVALSPRGPRNATPEMWKRCAALAEEADLRLHTHVNESREQADRLGERPEGRDVVALESWGVLSERLVMAHCVWLSAEEVGLVRSRGAHVCHCPSANLKLASGIAPVPEYLEAGINVALGADGSACNDRLDAFTEMRLAGLVHRPRRGMAAVSAAAVLEMATMGGARALGAAHEIGSLEVGKKADLVTVRADRPHTAPGLGGDPVEQLVFSARGSDVDKVVVDGRIVVSDGSLLTADEATVVADAETQRLALLARAALR
ncbi:amidohydrolase family protein [Iamia sp. SCSIO 61187]|uniref:amidohydrolase family protein n=1 Tax=Iamia sp. SCSIO 61187 TaxID=2722752 RepID=UPI001C62DA04|nr:amidohydrolase family protein [Iamia sp. SCSIO 61187]QYG91034.1 amidohydrolase family protein [Iamia sp. SCSIO 61187]